MLLEQNKFSTALGKEQKVLHQEDIVILGDYLRSSKIQISRKNLRRQVLLL